MHSFLIHRVRFHDGLLLTFGVTLQRLKFPTNVSVHTSVAILKVEYFTNKTRYSLFIASNFLGSTANTQFVDA